MAVKRVKLPNGTVLRLDVGDDVTDEEIIEFASQQYEKDFYDSFDQEDNFAVDIAKGFSSGALQAIANTAAGVQSGAAFLAGDDPDSEFLQKLQDNASSIRSWSRGVDKRLGLDEDFAESIPGQVMKGFGQMAVQLPATVVGAVGGTVLGGPAGGVAGGLALGGGTMMAQMQTEAVMDAERTLNKNLDEFSEQERDQTAVTSLSYGAIGGALEYAPVSKFIPKPLKNKVVKFFSKGKKRGMLSGSEVKEVVNSLKKDVAQGAVLEGFTEAAQGQLLDTLAASTYDDDRDLISFDVLKQRTTEAIVGGIVGGGTTAFTGTVSRAVAPEQTKEVVTSGNKEFKVQFDIINEGVNTDLIRQPQTQKIIATSLDEANEIAKAILMENPKADLKSIKVFSPEEVVEDALIPDIDLEDEVTFAPTETVGVFGDDVDLDSMDLTPQQKTEIVEVRQQSRAEAREILTALADPTANLDPEVLRQGIEALSDPTGQLNQATVDEGILALADPTGTADEAIIQEGLRALEEVSKQQRGQDPTVGVSQLDIINEFKVRRAQEQATKDAPYKPKRRKELYAKLRELDKRSFDALATVNPYVRKRGYEPTSEQDYDSEIDMRLEDAAYMETVPQVSAAGVRSATVGASPIQIGKQDPDLLLNSAMETVESIDNDVDLEHGEVTSEIVSGDTISEPPTVGASINLPNAPLISRKQFKGKKGFFYFSDRTKVGNYTGLFPEDGINIKLQGGPGYPFTKQNSDKSAGWAFTSKNIFSKFLDKVKSTDGLGFITLYKKENLRANGTFLKAYVAEVKAAIKAKRLTTKQFLETANTAREQVLNLKSKNAKTGKIKFTVARDGKGYGLFSKPFKSVAAFEKAMELVGFEPRGKMFDTRDKVITRGGVKTKVTGELSGGRLASITNINKGLPDVLKMIDLFTDPAFDNVNRGEIVGAVQFDKEQIGPTTAQELGTEEHLSYPIVIKGKGVGTFSDSTSILDIVKTDKRTNEALRSAETSMPVGTVGSSTANNLTPKQLQVIGSVVNKIKNLSSKLNIPIVESTNLVKGRDAQYNYETMTIEYNPVLLSARGKKGAEAALREEVIHAAMHQVINRKSKDLGPKEAFIKTMERIGQALTPQQRDRLNEVYGEQLDATNAGAEYARFITQQLLYGRTTESTMLKEGKAFDLVKSLLRAVHSTIVRALKGDIQTNDEVALLIRDTASLIRSADPEAKVPYQAQTAAAQLVANRAEGKDDLTADDIANPTGEDVDALLKRKKKILGVQGLKDFFYTPSRILQEISPKLYEIMQQWQQAIMTKSLDAKKLGQPFFKKLNAITDKKDLAKLERHLMYSPTKEQIQTTESQAIIAERDRLLAKYGLFNEYQLTIKPIFDTIYNENKSQGKNSYRFEYFPRFVKDMESYLRFLGKNITTDFKSYVEKLNVERGKNRESLINIDTPYAAYVFNQYILSQRFNKTRSILSKEEQRKVDFIDEEAMPFYFSPSESFKKYVDSSYRDIETTRLLGNSGGLDFNIEKLQDLINRGLPIGTFGQTWVDLVQDPNVDQQKLFIEAPNIITTMLAPTVSTGNDFLGGLNSFAYGALMLEPTSALSNAYELAFATLENGILPVIQAMLGTKVTLKDIGVDKEMFSAEYDPDTGGIRRFVDKGLKLTGFKKMDQFIKETTLTTNYNRYRRAAMKPKSSGAYKKLLAELDFRMPSYKDKVIYDLRNNTPKSPEVRLFLFTKLSETQPISELELPAFVKKHPNARTLLLMKTFIVKQANFVFQRYISVMTNKESTVGERAIAAKDLGALLMFFLLIGIPIDALKDLLAGRDMYPKDYFFNSLFRIFGISKYNSYQFQRSPTEFAFSYVSPVAIQLPFDIMGQMLAIVNEKTMADPDRLLTPLPFSDLWYYRYGPGVESQKRKRYRKLTDKDERPVDIRELLNL